MTREQMIDEAVRRVGIADVQHATGSHSDNTVYRDDLAREIIGDVRAKFRRIAQEQAIASADS